MPVTKIIIEILDKPSPERPNPVLRVLEYDAKTHQWIKTNGEGLFMGEIKLLNAINEVKAKYGAV